MNRMLQYAQKEVNKLKQTGQVNNLTTFDIVIVFDRSEEEMKRLTGYEAFEKALNSLGGKRTESNIQRACEISKFNRGSVCYGNHKRENISIPVKCTKALAKQVIISNR